MTWVHGSFGTYFAKNWKRPHPLFAEHGRFVASDCGIFRGKEEGHSDRHSRGLSHHSTGTDAGGLDFRVRDGTG